MQKKSLHQISTNQKWFETEKLSTFHFRQGQDFGDEYFAELDMIESVEGRKEGYESDVEDGKFEIQNLCDCLRPI